MSGPMINHHSITEGWFHDEISLLQGTYVILVSFHPFLMMRNVFPDCCICQLTHFDIVLSKYAGEHAKLPLNMLTIAAHRPTNLPPPVFDGSRYLSQGPCSILFKGRLLLVVGHQATKPDRCSHPF